jgi:hypothetical protein
LILRFARETAVKLARWLKYLDTIVALVVACGPAYVPAAPVDPAIMAKIGPKKANPGQNKKQLMVRP